MDHRGLRARLAGAGCTSCGAAIPGDRIVILADRGDLAFVELRCPSCASCTMGLVTRPDAVAGPAMLDTAVHPEMDPATDARRAGRPAMSWDDVAAMHDLLTAWNGDLRSLVRGADGIGGGSER
jgi:hypothetical protein